MAERDRPEKGQDYGGKTVNPGKGPEAQHLEEGSADYAEAPDTASDGKEDVEKGIPEPLQKPMRGVRTDEVELRDEGQQPK